MNTFAKSILNYFATYTETRFRFQSKSLYKWTNDHLTCDFPVFPDFQKKLLDTIKAQSQIDFSVRKGEYTVVLDVNEFKERLIKQLENPYNLDYLKKCVEETLEEQGDISSENNSEQTAALDEQILHNALRKFNLAFRDIIGDMLLKLQEDKKKELAHYIKDSAIPDTTFNPNVIERSIYDSFRESASKSKDIESFYKKIKDIISKGSWSLEMYDLYSMIRKFTAVLNQTMGTVYIFFHEILSAQDEEIQSFPLFLIELSIEERPDIVRIRSERGVLFINTPAINSFNFESVLTIPRAARFVEAPNYLSGVEKFIQNSYDFFNTFLLEHGFDPLVAPNKPRITFRVGFQIVLKEDRKLLDYSELITRIDAGQGGKFIDFIKSYVSGNVHNTTDEVDTEYKKRYPPKTAASILSTIPLSLNKTQKRILTALENPKNEIIVIDGPPGTGKSYTIVAMAYWANQNNKSVVITSHKKAAIDVLDRMMTDYFRKLHPQAKPSIMRISRNESECVNNYQNTLASPVISVATRRVNEFNRDAVEKDIKEWEKKIASQTERYWENTIAYKDRINDLFHLEQIEEKLTQQGILTEQNRPEKIIGSNIDLTIIEELVKQLSDDVDDITIEKLTVLANKKESIDQLIQTCNVINNLPLSIPEITGLKSISTDTLTSFERILNELSSCLKPDSEVFSSKLKFRFFTKKKKEMPERIKQLNSLEFHDLLENIEKICNKTKNNLVCNDLVIGLSKNREIEKARTHINEFVELCNSLQFIDADTRDIYNFLKTTKELVKKTDSATLNSLSRFADIFEPLLADSNLKADKLRDLKSLFDKNGTHKELSDYIRLFVTGVLKMS